MSDNKYKIYKNPRRNETEDVKQYIPQYQSLGITPKDMGKKTTTNISAPAPIKTRREAQTLVEKNITTRQPYSPVTQPLIGIGKSQIPNVGNNIEHIWTGVDGDIIDDISLPQDAKLIDNNDYVDGGDDSENDEHLIENEKVSDKDKINVLFTLNKDKGEYVLFVKTSIFAIGSAEEVQEIARMLVFGTEEQDPIDLEEILILKKINLKVGVFLD